MRKGRKRYRVEFNTKKLDVLAIRLPTEILIQVSHSTNSLQLLSRFFYFRHVKISYKVFLLFVGNGI